MDAREELLLNWLCTPKELREPSTKVALAEDLGVSESWVDKKRREPEFLARWEAQYRRTIGSPERMQAVMEALYETATDRTDPRQVQAAREYRAAVEGVRPNDVNITVKKDLKEMSAKELAELAAQWAAEDAQAT